MNVDYSFNPCLIQLMRRHVMQIRPLSLSHATSPSLAHCGEKKKQSKKKTQNNPLDLTSIRSAIFRFRRLSVIPE